MSTQKTSTADLFDINNSTLLTSPSSETINIAAAGDATLAVSLNKVSMYFGGEEIILAFIITNTKDNPLDVKSIKQFVSFVDDTKDVKSSADYSTWSAALTIDKTDAANPFVTIDVSTTIAPHAQVIRYLRATVK